MPDDASTEPQPLTPDDTAARLEPLRKQIDALDQRLVELLNERSQVVVEVGKVKQAGEGVPIYAPDREQRVLAQVRRYNRGPLPDACLEAIWRELMSGSFALERPLRIGYLGPKASFSHLAARRQFGASVEYDTLTSIPAVFEETERGHIDLGMVPIENSTEGAVGDTLDSFLDTSVRVCAEVLLGIHHNLLANTPIEQVTKVYSHPQGLAQCRQWLQSQLPGAERLPVASTSKAAELAAAEPGAAAIASTLAAEMYGLAVQFANIEDHPNNTTRFFVIGRQAAKPTGDDKTAIMFTTEHKPGALTDVLDVLRDYGLNMTHIDKRPSKRENWRYVFFVEVHGSADEQQVDQAIAEARKHCMQLTVLGSFPRARDVL